MQNQQGPGDKLTPRDTTNMAAFLALCHATAITPFIRRRYGAEALGFNGFGAFILLLVMAGADETGGMMAYFFAWLIALVTQRTITIKNQVCGIYTHSRYDGWPWLAMKFCKRESTAKRWVEPLFCMLAGIALMQVSEKLGAFVLMGMVSLAMVEGISSWIDRVRVQRMRDAAMEMRRTADLYRGVDNY